MWPTVVIGYGSQDSSIRSIGSKGIFKFASNVYLTPGASWLPSPKPMEGLTPSKANGSDPLGVPCKLLMQTRDVSDAKISRSADADANICAWRSAEADAHANIKGWRSADVNADANIWNIINTTSINKYDLHSAVVTEYRICTQSVGV